MTISDAILDLFSYILGIRKGKGQVVISSVDGLTFTDDGEGNITITEDNG